jgi:restriction system protein
MDGLLDVFLWLALAACVAVLMLPSLPRLKGHYSRWRVHLRLKSALPASHYTVLRDLTLRRHGEGAETVQIDHLVISPYGIFVITNCARTGSVFGAERDPEWTRFHFRHRSRFPNPLLRNLSQIHCLQSLLGLDEAMFHSMVVFGGGADLQSAMPPHVTPLGGMLPYIQVRTGEVLGYEEAARTAAVVKSRRLPPGVQAAAARINRRRNTEGQRFGAQQAVLGLAMMAVLASAAGYLADNLSGVPGQFPDSYSERVQPARPSPFIEGAPPPRIDLPGVAAPQATRRRPDRESSLLCTYSAETRRCACFEPAGGEVYIRHERCRDLAGRNPRISQN